MRRAAAKPLDAGTGRVCASFDLDTAGWLSIGAPHERHGFVELSALPAFDERHRGDSAATRRHRLEMTRGEHAFLAVEIAGAPPALVADPSDPTRPRWTAAGMEVVVEAEPDASAIRQQWVVYSAAGARPRIGLRLRGRIDRPALAEITELEPPAPTLATTSLRPRGQTAWLQASELTASAVLTVSGAPVAWKSAGDRLDGALVWPADANLLRFTLEVGLSTPAAPERLLLSGRDLPAATGDMLVDRALAYVRGCTALRVGRDERTILTDHRLLPLSWTRDGYWQALALLAADGSGDRARVADHLRWLWRRCERPDGRWVRSHHGNGRRKDRAFQADQQLYPIVELADYWRLTGTLPVGVDWSVAVAEAWGAALDEVDEATGFISSKENAADDLAAAPFITASQILLWYAALRLAELVSAGALALDHDALQSKAKRVRTAFAVHIGSGSAVWPYAVDGAGLSIAYHDANDLPLALAPLWGFCAGDDGGWRATMAFAFSSANPGWADGPRSGLGSAHSPGPWALGDIQAWIHARVTGDAAAAAAALRRLEEVAFVDGMLPEAYGSADEQRIRHWFAWPGAALGALRLLDRDGRLGQRLSATGRGTRLL